MKLDLYQLLIDRIESMGATAFGEKYDLSIGTITNWKKNGPVKQLFVVQAIVNELGAEANQPEPVKTVTVAGRDVQFIQFSNINSFQYLRNFWQWLKTKGQLFGLRIQNPVHAECVVNKALLNPKKFTYGMVFFEKTEEPKTESQCQEEAPK